MTLTLSWLDVGDRFDLDRLILAGCRDRSDLDLILAGCGGNI